MTQKQKPTPRPRVTPNAYRPAIQTVRLGPARPRGVSAFALSQFEPDLFTCSKAFERALAEENLRALTWE